MLLEIGVPVAKMIPRPPELKSNEPIVSKDWRLAL